MAGGRGREAQRKAGGGAGGRGMGRAKGQRGGGKGSICSHRFQDRHNVLVQREGPCYLRRGGEAGGGASTLQQVCVSELHERGPGR